MSDATDFIAELRYQQLPSDVVVQAQLCLLDLAGVGAAGTATKMCALMRHHALENYGAASRSARLLFDGRRASPVGAAMAGAATIDSLDAHDGHALTKGHTGVAVLPALLAFADGMPEMTGAQLLTALVVGYEVGIRAGMALHSSTEDYHSSGAWNALACAAVGARLLGLRTEQSSHALGLAEYHGPRSQMMRCIDHPTMVKDGSAWGAAAGVSAALLAADGFTGAPAATLAGGSARLWDDLGRHWRIRETYLKPFPVCRWAQPAVQAVLDLRLLHRVAAADVERVDVFAFHAATRLAVRAPATTEEAQYSLPFAVATALVHGAILPGHLDDLDDPTDDVHRLASGMTMVEDAAYEQQFPEERESRVHLVLRDGRRLEGPSTRARGGPENALDEGAVSAKYLALAEGALGQRRTARLRDSILELPDTSVRNLLDQLLERPAGD